jgi:hypothetical protein
VTLAELERDIVILAAAVSAGIHGALAPEHFDETAGAGVGFVFAAVALGVVAAWLTWRPASNGAIVAAGALFAGLILSYALATTTGLPLLHPDPEPVDGLALATKAIEAVGLLASLRLAALPRTKEVPTWTLVPHVRSRSR